MKRLAFLMLAGVLSLPVRSAVLNYGANEHQSVWTSDGSLLECTLRHDIPAFGRAEFRQKAGGELAFVLDSYERPFRTGGARLTSVPPPWRHDELARDLGTVDFADGNPPFRVPRPVARRLLTELERGMFPTLAYSDWADGSDQVTVHLSAVNVRDALGEFRACMRAILPFTFEHVRTSRLQFDFGRADLTRAAKTRLDEVALYLSGDSSVRRVELEGHTDSRGFRRLNRSLGKRRAQAVRDYLVGKGVASELLVIKSFGEREPIATNRTANGRSQNRRVDIVLRR